MLKWFHAEEGKQGMG